MTAASWRWVFSVNVPVGVAGFAFGPGFLSEHRKGRGVVRPVRVRAVRGGAGLADVRAVGVISRMDLPLILAATLAGVVLLAVLVRVELRAAEPMIRLRLLANRLFASTTAVMFTGIWPFWAACT